MLCCELCICDYIGPAGDKLRLQRRFVTRHFMSDVHMSLILRLRYELSIRPQTDCANALGVALRNANGLSNLKASNYKYKLVIQSP